MKQLILILLSLILTLMPQSLAHAASATLSLSPSSGTFNKGCSFSLDLILDTAGADTDGTDAILLYDQSRFSATSIKNGTIYSDYPGNNIDSSSGKITISGLASVNQAFKGSGTLATVNFTVLDAAPTGSSLIKFEFDANDKGKTTDSNVVERGTVADILSSVTNGNYTVGSGSCAAGTQTGTTKVTGGPTQTATPTATKAPVPTKKTIDDLATGGKQPGSPITETLIFAAIGALLTIVGILGLVLL